MTRPPVANPTLRNRATDKNDVTNRLSAKTVDELKTIREFAVGRVDGELVHLCDKEIARRDPLGRVFWASVAAYEQLLTEKNGTTTKANRVRNKLNRLGGTIEAMTQMLEQWALDPAKVGFANLLEAGMPEQMAEYIVAYRFPDRFSERAVESAKAKLDKYGIAGPEHTPIRDSFGSNRAAFVERTT